MIKKKELGQAFILVLIILAIGALVVVPTLRLTTTVLKSNEVITQRTRGLYACEAAQQKVMWMLLHGTLVDQLGYEAGENSANFTVDVCGTTVHASVVMRAVEIEGGVVLSGEHTIMPTKTVTPTTATRGIDDTFTYIIHLEQVSTNNSGKLNAIYDILPADLKEATTDYVIGSSYFRVDGGEWEQIGDPEIDTQGGQYRLRWPDPDTYGSENFTSPTSDFALSQVKELKFSVQGAILADDTVQCNWVVISVGDLYTVSGPQAPIVVGEPENPEGCDTDGTFAAAKTSDPTVIPPLVSTNVTYTIHIMNMDGNTNHIAQIDDFLPPGFEYIAEPTGGDIQIESASVTTDNVNGVVRQHLLWDTEQLGGGNGWGIGAGENLTLTFRALATQGISGNYYNEVLVSPNNVPSPTLFTQIEPDYDWSSVFGTTYSWNSGVVIVPAYDSETTADGENITANMALEPDHVRTLSWNVE